MGEGWSDWLGLMITMFPGDQAADPRGVGTYVTNEPVNGNGIRPAPYSTDPGVNNYKYGNTNSTTLSEPHGIGFVWASMLWDLNWALVTKYGFEQDIYKSNSSAGNIKANKLIMEGFKLQACSPATNERHLGRPTLEALRPKPPRCVAVPQPSQQPNRAHG